MSTQCTCGIEHAFEGAAKAPDSIICENCPVCTGVMEEDDDFVDYDFSKPPDGQSSEHEPDEKEIHELDEDELKELEKIEFDEEELDGEEYEEEPL